MLDLAELVQDAFEERTGERPPLEAPAPPPDRRAGPVPRVGATGWPAAGSRPRAAPLREAVRETVAFCLDHRSSLYVPA